MFNFFKPRIVGAVLILLSTSPLAFAQGLKTECKAVGGWIVQNGSSKGSCDEQGWMQGPAYASHPALLHWTVIAEFKNGLPIGDWVVVKNTDLYAGVRRNLCNMIGMSLDGEKSFSWKSMECKTFSGPGYDNKSSADGSITMIAADRFKFDGKNYRSGRFSIEGDGVFPINLAGFSSAWVSMSIRAEVESVEQREPPWQVIQMPVVGQIADFVRVGRIDKDKELPVAIKGTFSYSGFGKIGEFRLTDRRMMGSPPRVRLEFSRGVWREVVVGKEGDYWSYSDSNGYLFETTPEECGFERALWSKVKFDSRLNFRFEREEDFLSHLSGCGELRMPGKAPVRGQIDGRTKTIKPF